MIFVWEKLVVMEIAGQSKYELQSLRQVKVGKEREEEMIEVHIKFETLMFIYSM